MSKKTEQQYFGDMLDYSRQAVALVHGKTRLDFDADLTLQFALARLVMIVGEAANRISPESRARHPEIPWPQIIATRHRLVHDYGNVDYVIVWGIATERLPELIAALEKITPPEPPSA